MRTSVPTSPNPLTENSGAPVARGRVTAVHAGWRSVVKRVITCTACAMTVSSLLLPNVTWAAEWVNVEGVQYDAAHDGGSWAWDGANDFTLNNYTGGPISAAGELNVTYSGANAVTGAGDGGITVEDGENESASLAISNNGAGSLTVTDENNSAIQSDGNIDISGSGKIDANGGEYGIHAAGTALTISGGGNITAVGHESDGIYSSGDLTIGGGTTVDVTSTEYRGMYASDTLKVEGGSTLSVNSSGFHGVTAWGDIIVDASTVKSNVVDGDAIHSNYGAVVIRNGSLVEALATASNLNSYEEAIVGIYSGDERDEENRTTASIDISNSTVKATSRFAPECEREGKLSIGIYARSEDDHPSANISIDRSNVTASGDDLGILVEHGTWLGDDVTVKPQGTIRITDCNIVVPGNGQIVDFERTDRWASPGGELRGYDYCGQTIASGEENAPTVVIKTPEEPAPTPAPEPSGKPADTMKPAAANVKPTAAKAASKVTADLPQTGDHASLMVATLGAVGIAALAIGAAVLRRRLS